MPDCSKNEVILVRYPFSDLTSAKVRPAIVVSRLDRSSDYLIVPLTSRISSLALGEFELADWRAAGLNVPSVVKRGVYTIHSSLIIKSLGRLTKQDAIQIGQSLRMWFEL
jgi:mRNA interferase MazF